MTLEEALKVAKRARAYGADLSYEEDQAALQVLYLAYTKGELSIIPEKK
jgi:hypothetical protein